MSGATVDLDDAQQQIDDAAASMNARTPTAQRSLDRARIRRSRSALAKARRQRAELRAALLLDDEEPDGQS